MPFTDIAPAEANTVKTGISFSLSEGKKSGTVRISFTAQAQEEIWGFPIKGKKFHAQVGRGTDEGKLLIVQQDDGDLEGKPSMHGSASLKMKSWDLLPKGKRPAAPIELLHAAMGGFLFQLPSWTKPSGVGGKMEEDFGLKKTGTRG